MLLDNIRSSSYYCFLCFNFGRLVGIDDSSQMISIQMLIKSVHVLFRHDVLDQFGGGLGNFLTSVGIRLGPVVPLLQITQIPRHGNVMLPRHEQSVAVQIKPVGHERFVMKQNTRHGQFGQSSSPRRTAAATKINLVFVTRHYLRIHIALIRLDLDSVLVPFRVVRTVANLVDKPNINPSMSVLILLLRLKRHVFLHRQSYRTPAWCQLIGLVEQIGYQFFLGTVFTNVLYHGLTVPMGIRSVIPFNMS
mmetsp:Transcript_13475/g.19862  ORF Transcript_13475/g.19862 Transcript_13475/m.19862 type:complete len:249 (+) Transcript_13475:123-869(+)